MKVLIKFTHGLGDAVQLTIVLRHLRRLRPDWDLTLFALRGKHSVGRGYCETVYHEQEPAPDQTQFGAVFELFWHECYSIFDDSPCSKAVNCLREVFGIQPIPELMQYQLHVNPADIERARVYLEANGCRMVPETGRYNVVALHYQGNTSSSKKDLHHHEALSIVSSVMAIGYVPLLLDWDNRSPVRAVRGVINPGVYAGDLWGNFGSGDAGALTALLSLCSAAVGIDSGPQKCMLASGVPTLCVWTQHMPVQFADLNPATHLVPSNWRDIPPCQNPGPAAYMLQHYRLREYETGIPTSLAGCVRKEMYRMLSPDVSREGGLVNMAGWWVTEGKEDQDFVVIEDVHARDGYYTCHMPSGKNVIDIGAHIGCFARKWREKVPDARIVCVEVNPHNIKPLRKNVGEFAKIVNAACTYEEAPWMLDACKPGGLSTGGTRIVSKAEYDAEMSSQYDKGGQVEAITLDALMQQFDMPIIDILKLDCEGSEFSILEHAPIEKIRFICGEYHGFDRWERFRQQRFAGWDYGHMSRHEGLGNFHLRNPFIETPW